MARRTPAPKLDQALADALEHSGQPETNRELDATTALLAEHGVRNWTVDDVARHSGIARATLYRRYGSRDTLIQLAVTREARRFFRAIAAEVATRPTIAEGAAGQPDGLTAVVVDGLLMGLRLAQKSPLGELIRREPSTAMALIASSKLLDAATTALADLYLAMSGDQPDTRSRQQAEAGAEALVRLAVSFLLIPQTISDGDDQRSRRVRDMVAPLVEAGRCQPAERLLQNCC